MSAIPRQEILAQLDQFVESQLHFLSPIEKAWQPSDLLPSLTAPDWHDQLLEFRRAALAVPDTVLVTLVANMITEEALPSYHAWLSNLHGHFDRTGVGKSGLALWIRGWVAEEKRHGDTLSRYLFATGRVDLRAVEVTMHHLLRNGFDPLTENDVFRGFIYTSFQERATCVAHAGTGRMARQSGDLALAKICDTIAGDEAKHERAYEAFVEKLFELDPDAAMIALEDMLRKTIVMPSRTMTDGTDPELFSLFSTITQRNGIYTTFDYAKIMSHLIRLWGVETRQVRADAAKSAQEFVCKLPPRYLKLAERAEARAGKAPRRPISWIFGRIVEI